MTTRYTRFLLTGMLLLASSLPVLATHIVGGELGLTYVRRATYDLRLTLYFDQINGNPGAIDQLVQVFIFPKGGFSPVDTIVMSLDPNRPQVQYTNPDCANTANAVRTSILTYLERITLDPNRYNDPDGYYIVWERCCRNGAITNILSPGQTGQAFYLEFPAIKTGPSIADELKNSSPTLFRPLSDFACVGQDFFFDFSGSDPDGDSLVYSISPPYRGNTSETVVGGRPCSRCGWKVIVVLTTRAHRLIHRATLIESRSSSINVFCT